MQTRCEQRTMDVSIESFATFITISTVEFDGIWSVVFAFPTIRNISVDDRNLRPNVRILVHNPGHNACLTDGEESRRVSSLARRSVTLKR